MTTLSYIMSNEEKIKIGSTYYFGQLWDGEGDGEELLESGVISSDGENMLEFEILEPDEDISKIIVKIIDIY